MTDAGAVLLDTSLFSEDSSVKAGSWARIPICVYTLECLGKEKGPVGKEKGPELLPPGNGYRALALPALVLPCLGVEKWRRGALGSGGRGGVPWSRGTCRPSLVKRISCR